jgi:hypothetical protein
MGPTIAEMVSMTLLGSSYFFTTELVECGPEVLTGLPEKYSHSHMETSVRNIFFAQRRKGAKAQRRKENLGNAVRFAPLRLCARVLVGNSF